MLNITKNLDGNKLTIALEGKLDTITAPDFEASVRESIGDAKELVFDLAGLEYITSAGLRVLLSAQKTMNEQGAMKVVNVNEDINEVFEVTGFSDFLNIE
jgi:anti-sigma B factor antagonist